MERKAIENAVIAAHAAPAKAAQAFGCGRAYVCVSGDRATINAVAAACRKLGRIFQRRAYYGLRNAIYVGYDNATGRETGKAEGIAAALNAAGIEAYAELCAD